MRSAASFSEIQHPTVQTSHSHVEFKPNTSGTTSQGCLSENFPRKFRSHGRSHTPTAFPRLFCSSSVEVSTAPQKSWRRPRKPLRRRSQPIPHSGRQFEPKVLRSLGSDHRKSISQENDENLEILYLNGIRVIGRVYFRF